MLPFFCCLYFLPIALTCSFYGFSFYTGAPLSLCCNFAREVFEYVENWITEFIVNGKDRMPPLEFQWSEYLCPLLKLGWCQWVGAVIFFWGWLHQRRSHAILVSMTVQSVHQFLEICKQVNHSLNFCFRC